jgi:heme exporter protein A
MFQGLLEAEGLQCVRGGRRVFSGIGLRAETGALLRIEGDNGAGKTSLLRMLCGLTEPHAGEIRWCGAPLAACRETHRAELLYIGHQNALKEDLSGAENLRYAAALRGDALSEEEARGALHALGADAESKRPVRALSQGQKRRVALAALALPRPRALWLLDEPFVALDTAAMTTVSDRIATHVQAGGIAVYTTHQDVRPHAVNQTTLRLMNELR